MTDTARTSRDLKDRSKWRLDIQGMRGLTMIVIVLFHAGLPIPGGFVSLDAFFVISGFVISGMLDREHQQTGTLSLRRFYLRRFKRLTPALITMLIVVVVLSGFLLSPFDTQKVTAETALGATFLAANIVVQVTSGGYFDLSADLNPLLHTWSLSLEEQFYLVFPTVLFLGWMLTRRCAWPKSTAVFLLAAMGALSLSLALIPITWLPQVLQSQAFIGYYSPVVRTWEFAAGALLYFATKKLQSLHDSWGLVFGISGLVLFFAPMWLIDETVRYPGPWTLVPVTGTILLLLAGFSRANAVSRFLGSKPMVFTGDRSYSWYLWHWPVIVFALALFPELSGVALLAAALSIVPALISFRWVENPLRRKPMSDRNIASMTLGMLLASTLAAVGLLVGTSTAWGNPDIREGREVLLSPHLSAQAGCHVYEALPPNAYDDCWLTDGGGAPIMLVGDSSADHLSEALVGAGSTLGRPVSVTSASSCPFVDPNTLTNAYPEGDRCLTYFGRTMEWLESQTPGTVLISTTGAQFESAALLGDYDQALTATVVKLQAVGHSVLIVQPIPRVPPWGSNDRPWDPRGCSLPSVVSGGCGVEWDLDEVSNGQVAIWRVNAAVASDTDASLVSFQTDLCPAGSCYSGSNPTWVYRDVNHLTSDESAALSSSLISQASGLTD